MLWLLLALPAPVAVYVLMLRRNRKLARRYAGLSMVRAAIGGSGGFRRHVPPFLFFLALATLTLSIARPAAFVTLPSERGVIILTMDVSGSMRAKDVEPSRIVAARNAAKAFVTAQPPSTRVGLVAFSSNAMLVQTPTSDRDEAIAAIDQLRPQRYTAIGSGIMVALKAIFPDIPFDLVDDSPFMRRGIALNTEPKPVQPDFQPVPPGSYKSAAIVLLSDGQSNVGADPVEAARQAADRGVRVFTVGFGTPEGTTLDLGGFAMLVKLDEETLKKIADMTRGTYARATTETELKNIYQAITTQLVMERQKTEITALVAAGAAILAVFSAALSLLWFGRIA
jgi:Ca-activated chloride channel family protein